MYCARFDDGSATLRQVVLRFPHVVDPASHGGPGWHDRQRDAARRLLARDDVDFTVRVVVAGRAVERVLALSGVDVEAAVLEGAARPFLELDDGSGRLVHACATREAHDACLERVPAPCLQLAREPARHDGLPIYDEIRLRPVFETLPPGTWRGATAAWQGAFGRLPPDAAARREVARARVALAHDRGVPARLAAHQERLLAACDAAPWVVDECLFAGVDDEPRAREAVRHAFDAGPGPLGVPPRDLAAAPADLADWHRAALHGAWFAALPPHERPLVAATAADALAAVAWQLPEAWRAHGLANLVALGAPPGGDLQRIEARLGEIEQALRHAQRDAGECAEMRKAIGITREDPAFALVKARQILEQIVQRLYRKHRPGINDKALLFDMIRDLTGQSNRPAVLPRHIGNYLDTIRVLGNVEAHKGPEAAAPRGVSRHDVEVSLLMTLNVIEWYLLEHEGGPPVASA